MSRYFCLKWQTSRIYVSINQAIKPTSLNRYSTKACQEHFTISNQEYDAYLQSLEEEFDEINRTRSSETSLISKQMNTRWQELFIIVNLVKSLREKVSDLRELSSIESVDSKQDEEMRLMVDKEKKTSLEDIKQIEMKLVDNLAEREKTDNNDIILELTAGVGGQEAMLFTSEMLEMYIQYAGYKGWSIDSLRFDKNDIGGVRRATLEVNGRHVYKHLKYEAGVHRVQRIPKTERMGRVHTSTMSVAVLPQPTEIDVVLNAKDLKIETTRATGAGGQSVNKTDSAVRILHIPTGMIVECQEERHQMKNKNRALKTLRSRIYQKELEAQISERTSNRKNQVGTGGRSEKIRTYNFNQDRITDHRINQHLFQLDTFFMGGERLDDFIQSLIIESKYETLHSMIQDFTDKLRNPKSSIKKKR